ncbi:CAAX prenyl protease 2 [Strongyloides ratti]|uniref:CAAX prenyl protease 2 n=1 Tax=Strongyloides ratti TaxID=34506 RepID=A0A090MX82_STRRB|nr:CAAX prenyl protease 2 [Strongyloides ratti]CEF64979.1 CAAX prenyl protease 2 [Strongyloides ratti]
MVCDVGVGFCLIAPIFYLLVLWLFDYNGTDRNSLPSIIRRVTGALCCNVAFILIVHLILSSNDRNSFFEMGIKKEGIVASLFISPIPIICLYFGTIIMLGLDGILKEIFTLKGWSDCLTDRIFIRNVVFAPISEELAFRGFSLCHLHHILDDTRKGSSIINSLLARLFQCTYSYLFGVYAAFLFLRTGNVIAPIISHAICNCLGLPSIVDINEYQDNSPKIILYLCHIFGLVMFIYLLFPLTDTTLYQTI